MKILSGFTLLMLGLALASCSDHHAQDHGGHGAHEGDHADEDAKGPLGGRLLENDGFSLEVVIFERGMPPEYRLYPRLDGRAASTACQAASRMPTSSSRAATTW
jgi:membrane fusion protein, heavy metal efflux system